MLSKFAFKTQIHTIMKKQVLFFLLMLMPLMASAGHVEIDGIFFYLIQSKQIETNGKNSFCHIIIQENKKTRSANTF